MDFQESNLIFSFPENWYVLKYDEHKFFRLLSGDGLKGVDFIGFDERDQLFLMEVKNYRNINLHDGINPSEALLENPEIATEEYFNKFLDSLQLIRVVHQFYSRRWWYRFFTHRMLTFFSVFRKNPDWLFWYKAFNTPKNKTRYVLFLQLENEILKEKETMFFESLKKKFEQSFPAYPPLKILNTQDSGPIKIQPQTT